MADRPDGQYAAKEVCSWMTAPTGLAVVSLNRAGEICGRMTEVSVVFSLAVGWWLRVLHRLGLGEVFADQEVDE